MEYRFKTSEMKIPWIDKTQSGVDPEARARTQHDMENHQKPWVEQFIIGIKEELYICEIDPCQRDLPNYIHYSTIRGGSDTETKHGLARDKKSRLQQNASCSSNTQDITNGFLTTFVAIYCFISLEPILLKVLHQRWRNSAIWFPNMVFVASFHSWIIIYMDMNYYLTV